MLAYDTVILLRDYVDMVILAVFLSIILLFLVVWCLLWVVDKAIEAWWWIKDSLRKKKE